MKIYVIMKRIPWEGCYIQNEHVYTDYDKTKEIADKLNDEYDEGWDAEFYVETLIVQN